MRHELRLAGLYIHFPYCDIKCSYCDFYSIEQKSISPEFWVNYFNKLEKDLRVQVELFGPGIRLGSIFLGGGTPSKAPPHHISRLLNIIYDIFKCKPSNLEITCEVNPETASLNFLQAMHECGVNRLSVGIQSREPHILRYLGRLYDKSAYESIFQKARQAGFTNINCDILYGIPGQKYRKVLEDIDWALDSGVTHLSAYALTIEEGTRLAHEIRLGQKKNISSLKQQRIHELIRRYLNDRGFERYEVSNYAKPGRKCLHNLLYWKNRPYMGLGVSSHGYAIKKRYAYPRSLSKYLNMDKPQEIYVSDVDVFTGAVRISGRQNLHYYTKNFTHKQRENTMKILHKYHNLNWLILHRNWFRMNNLGMDFSDSILTELYNMLSSDDGRERHARDHERVLQV